MTWIPPSSIGGGFTNVSGTARLGFARINENGTTDPAFQSPFATIYAVSAIKLLANGQMLVTGNFATNETSLIVLARLNSNGSLDASFPPVTGSAIGTAIALQPDGKIIITHDHGASRFSANGVFDANYFQGAGDIANHGFVGLAVDASGRALVGGENASLNGTERRGLIRLFGGNAPVPTPPSIDVQPTDVTAFAGSNATFSVIASGSAPLIYNWYFGGTNVGGSATVTFNDVQLGNDGTSIYCIVTNLYGKATSSVVTLHVVSAPVTPMITANPISVSVTNPAPITASDLTEANLRGKILHLHILGGATPFPATGDYDIVLAASGNTYSIPAGGAMAARSGNWSFGSDLGINTVLTLDNSFPGMSGPVKVALLTDGTYEMYADGVVNNQHGTYTRVYLNGSPVGPTATFSVSANGTEPLTYQWLFNGSPILTFHPASLPVPHVKRPENRAEQVAAERLPDSPSVIITILVPRLNVYGENTSTLVISNATTADAGKYSVRVSNAAGSVPSTEATLTVNGYSGGALDLASPTLTIAAPSTKLKIVGSNSVNFAGTAQDNVGVVSIGISVNGGDFAIGTGTSNWTATVPLTPGTNIIRVRAADLAGNTATNTQVLVYVPTIPLAGIYNGLFFDTNSPSPVSAGAFTMSLTAVPTFKGKLRQGTKLYSFAGTFGNALTANTTVPRVGQSTLQLALAFANGRLEGTASDGANWTAQLIAYPAVPVGALGKYNVLWEPNFPMFFVPTNIPTGYGFASLALSAAGRLSGTATLGEGTPAKVLTTVSSAGHAPIYVPLYNGAGALFGWLDFGSSPNEVYGGLYWSKPGSVGGTRYPQGFTNGLFTTGSRYVAPLPGTPALTLTMGEVILTGGNLTPPITDAVTLGGDNKINGDHQLAITISAPKGSFTGSFVDPASSAKRTVKGVILRGQNIGGGQFLGTDQSGRVFIGDQ